MKKKVISAVLFGALALASTGTFVSCNDYDDEVNNLQEQINEDRAKSAALQNQLESYKAALENELKELKASYETQIAEAKAALESELQKKADATVVEALVERIVSLETGLSASVATLQSQIDVCNSAIEKLNAAIANCATVAELNAIKADAEGVGLMRSEFLYLERNNLPTEDELFEAYKKVAEIMGHRPVVIRTLNIRSLGNAGNPPRRSAVACSWGISRQWMYHP